MSIQPWLLWGSTQSIRMDQNAPTKGLADRTPQLAQVNYGRPETWRFLAVASIGDTNTAEQSDLVVIFNLSVGIGRAISTFPLGFFRFSNAGGLGGLSPKSAVRFRGVDNDDTLNEANFIDQFVADNISLQVTSNFVNAVPGRFVNFQVGFYVAPNVHVRPEWHSEMFSGGENRGR